MGGPAQGVSSAGECLTTGRTEGWAMEDLAFHCTLTLLHLESRRFHHCMRKLACVLMLSEAFRGEVVLCGSLIWLSGGQWAVEFKCGVCEVLKDSRRVTQLTFEVRSKVPCSHALPAATGWWPQGRSPCLLPMNLSTNQEIFSEFHSNLSLMHQHVFVCEPPSPLAYWILFQTKEWILPRLGGNVSEVRLQVHKAKRVRTDKIPSSGSQTPGPYGGMEKLTRGL